MLAWPVRSMRHLRLAFSAMIGVAFCLLAHTPAHGQGTAFRIAVDLVPITVTVSDAEQADFTIYENGRPQKLSFFDRASAPTALSILVDSSASMEPELGTAQAAAASLVAALRQGDVASIIDFDSRVTVTQTFTKTRRSCRLASRSCRPVVRHRSIQWRDFFTRCFSTAWSRLT